MLGEAPGRVLGPDRARRVGAGRTGALQSRPPHSSPLQGLPGARFAVWTSALQVFALVAGPRITHLVYPPRIPVPIPHPARTTLPLRYYRTRHTCCTVSLGPP